MTVQFLLSQSGTGGTSVPFQRRNAPTTTVAVSPLEAMRLKRYEEHWKFYQGLQWTFQREDAEPLVSANYCRVIVNKKASFLVGKGMIITTPVALNEITKPILDEVWRYNNLQSFLLRLAIMGGVTGDAFVMVTYKPPADAMLRVNPYTKGTIALRLLNSHQVFPYWDPLDMGKLLYVRIVTEVLDPGYAPNSVNDNGGAEGRNTFNRPGGMNGNVFAHSTAITNRKRRYIEDVYPDKIVEGWEGGEQKTRANDLGEIPIVHIANEPFPGEYYGVSDLDGIIDMQREFNEKMTDISDIVNYHAAPITIITGARAKNLEKGPKALWAGLPTDAKVFNLQLGGDLAMSHKYLELVRQIVLDISGVPDGSLGRTQPISNTSGAALAVQFQPLVEATERKAPEYEHGFEKINYFILRTHQLVERIDLPVDLCRCCGGRIIETPTDDGKKKRKCYLIDPQTLDFMNPDDVEVSLKRKFSYGVETRKLPYSRMKKEFLKESVSYWDPAPKKDLQAEAEEKHAVAQEHAADAAATQDRMTGTAMTGQPPPPPAAPAEPPQAMPEQLADYDMDVPEEPEDVRVVVHTWNAQTQSFEKKDLGTKKLVPSGCNRPTYLSPYETAAKLKSALPRDKQLDTNLYASWQQNGWVDRHWIMEHLDEDINLVEVDKRIADDIPFLNALQGKPNQTGQVAQTSGLEKGDSHGAPPPPGPGPGRGNLRAPGDNLATPPPNAAPGSPV